MWNHKIHKIISEEDEKSQIRKGMGCMAGFYRLISRQRMFSGGEGKSLGSRYRSWKRSFSSLSRGSRHRLDESPSISSRSERYYSCRPSIDSAAQSRFSSVSFDKNVVSQKYSPFLNPAASKGASAAQSKLSSLELEENDFNEKYSPFLSPPIANPASTAQSRLSSVDLDNSDANSKFLPFLSPSTSNLASAVQSRFSSLDLDNNDTGHKSSPFLSSSPADLRLRFYSKDLDNSEVRSKSFTFLTPSASTLPSPVHSRRFSSMDLDNSEARHKSLSLSPSTSTLASAVQSRFSSMDLDKREVGYKSSPFLSPSSSNLASAVRSRFSSMDLDNSEAGQKSLTFFTPSASTLPSPIHSRRFSSMDLDNSEARHKSLSNPGPSASLAAGVQARFASMDLDNSEARHKSLSYPSPSASNLASSVQSRFGSMDLDNTDVSQKSFLSPPPSKPVSPVQSRFSSMDLDNNVGSQKSSILLSPTASKLESPMDSSLSSVDLDKNDPSQKCLPFVSPAASKPDTAVQSTSPPTDGESPKCSTSPTHSASKLTMQSEKDDRTIQNLVSSKFLQVLPTELPGSSPVSESNCTNEQASLSIKNQRGNSLISPEEKEKLCSPSAISAMNVGSENHQPVASSKDTESPVKPSNGRGRTISVVARLMGLNTMPVADAEEKRWQETRKSGETSSAAAATAPPRVSFEDFAMMLNEESHGVRGKEFHSFSSEWVPAELACKAQASFCNDIADHSSQFLLTNKEKWGKDRASQKSPNKTPDSSKYAVEVFSSYRKKSLTLDGSQRLETTVIHQTKWKQILESRCPIDLPERDASQVKNMKKQNRIQCSRAHDQAPNSKSMKKGKISSASEKSTVRRNHPSVASAAPSRANSDASQRKIMNRVHSHNSSFMNNLGSVSSPVPKTKREYPANLSPQRGPGFPTKWTRSRSLPAKGEGSYIKDIKDEISVGMGNSECSIQEEQQETLENLSSLIQKNQNEESISHEGNVKESFKPEINKTELLTAPSDDSQVVTDPTLVGKESSNISSTVEKPETIRVNDAYVDDVGSTVSDLSDDCRISSTNKKHSTGFQETNLKMDGIPITTGTDQVKNPDMDSVKSVYHDDADNVDETQRTLSDLSDDSRVSSTNTKQSTGFQTTNLNMDEIPITTGTNQVMNSDRNSVKSAYHVNADNVDETERTLSDLSDDGRVSSTNKKHSSGCQTTNLHMDEIPVTTGRDQVKNSDMDPVKSVYHVNAENGPFGVSENMQDYSYVKDIFVESGILNDETELVFHSLGFAMDPNLFFLLEQKFLPEPFSSVPEKDQRQSEHHKTNKIHRQLIFHVVNEILFSKLTPYLLQPWAPTKKSLQTRPSGQLLLKYVCDKLHYLKPTPGLDICDATSKIIEKDLDAQLSQWSDQTIQIAGIAAYLEKLIFNDLIIDFFLDWLFLKDHNNRVMALTCVPMPFQNS